MNWDDDASRTRILAREFAQEGMIVFDELHKFSRWRNFLKGLYDSHHAALQILVTGSARLDLYRRGGDSLQGRYHHLRLYPFSLKEAGCSLTDLMTLGPFPEPLLSGSLRTARRWAREYRSRLVREDVVSLERVDELGALEQLSLRLPALVGSPLSLNALREDLQVAHKTVERWLDIFDRLLFTFRLAPFGSPRIKAVKKSRKHYHFLWTAVPDEGPRFENVVAFHLLKECHYLEDTEGHDAELRFFRDIEGREVDFVQLLDGQAIRFVECKVSDTAVSPALLYLRRKFPGVDAIQVLRQAETRPPRSARSSDRERRSLPERTPRLRPPRGSTAPESQARGGWPRGAGPGGRSPPPVLQRRSQPDSAVSFDVRSFGNYTVKVPRAGRLRRARGDHVSILDHRLYPAHGDDSLRTPRRSAHQSGPRCGDRRL